MTLFPYTTLFRSEYFCQTLAWRAINYSSYKRKNSNLSLYKFNNPNMLFLSSSLTLLLVNWTMKENCSLSKLMQRLIEGTLVELIVSCVLWLNEIQLVKIRGQLQNWLAVPYHKGTFSLLNVAGKICLTGHVCSTDFWVVQNPNSWPK